MRTHPAATEATSNFPEYVTAKVQSIYVRTQVRAGVKPAQSAHTSSKVNRPKGVVCLVRSLSGSSGKSLPQMLEIEVQAAIGAYLDFLQMGGGVAGTEA